MKAIRNLKVILVVLIVILISVISFGGIYYVNKGRMTNRLPDYILGSNIKGYRHVTLVASEDTQESKDNTNSNTTGNTTNTKENTTNTTENATNTTENATNTTENATNSANTAENYRKSANIIKRRLKKLNVDNYNITCDENSGRIVIDIPEDDKTDIILSDLTEIGKFTIEDSETGEVLLDNSDVKSVKFGQQNSGTSSSSSLVMGIEFDSKGTKKFRDVTKEYQNNVNENAANETSNTSSADNTNATENTTENATNETSSSENSTGESNTTDSQNSSEKKDKKVKIKIDDAEILTTDFSEVIDNGVLTLTVGNATDDSQKNSALNIGAIIENDPLPVKYTIEGNTYIESPIDENALNIIIYALIIIALIIAFVLIIKYRAIGILQVILSVGYIGLLLIVVRYANVVVSLEGILSIFVCYVINSVFAFMISKVLNNKDLTKKESKKLVNNVYKKYCLIVIPEMVIALICLFTSWSAIFSFGMILFWGIVISIVYNFVITEFINK